MSNSKIHVVCNELMEFHIVQGFTKQDVDRGYFMLPEKYADKYKYIYI